MSKDILLKRIFSESLGVDESIIQENLEYNTISEWDSIGHMALVAALEQDFEVMFDTDDIIEMSSVKKAKEILIKHGIVF